MRKQLLIVLMALALLIPVQAQAAGGYSVTVYLSPDEGPSGTETLVMVRARPQIIGRYEYTEILYLYIFYDGASLVEREPSKKVGELYAYSWDAMITIPESTMGNHTIEVWLEYATGRFSKCVSSFTVTDSPFIEVIQGATGETGETGATGPRGSRGLTGAVGSEGLQGAQGMQGSPGPEGEGAPGPQGLRGPPGSTMVFDVSVIALVVSIISLVIVLRFSMTK